MDTVEKRCTFFSVYHLEGPVDAVITALHEHKARLVEQGALPDSVKLEVRYWDEGYQIELAYRRPMTEAETSAAQLAQVERDNKRRERELQTLRELKAKYEGE